MLNLLLATLGGTCLARTLVVDPNSKETFRTLSSAVAFSTDGDEIIMAPDSYRDSIVVNHTITINGQGSVLQAKNNAAIIIEAPSCIISNLTVTGDSDTSTLILNSENNTINSCRIVSSSIAIKTIGNNAILNNTVEGTSYGVLAQGIGIIAKGNNMTGSMIAGISLSSSNNSSIVDNSFNRCSMGLEIKKSVGCTVYYNEFQKGKLGISVNNGSENLIGWNNCSGQEIASIYLESCTRNEIANNSLYNSGNGIMLKSSPMTDIVHNLISQNIYGITFKGSGQNVLSNNVMENNSYNLRIEAGGMSNLRLLANQDVSDVETDFVQDIDASNTVDGKPICYMVGLKNVSVPEGCSLVGLIKCENVSVKNQMLANGSFGLLMVSSNGCLIENCTVSNSEMGISALDCEDSEIGYNSMKTCGTGVWISNSYDLNLHDNVARNCTDEGFKLEGVRRIAITDSKAIYNNVGFQLLDALSCSITRANASFNVENGLRLMGSHKTTVKETTADKNDKGLALTGSNTCSIINNSMNGNAKAGLSLEQLTDGDVSYNKAFDNKEGIFVQSASSISVTHNTLYNNTMYGLHFSSSKDCEVIENRVEKNGMAGIGLTDCNGIALYHNALMHNGQNAVDNGDNNWDMGEAIRGNYWSDVQDPTQQRQIPSRGVDRYPLMVPWGI